MMFSTIRQVQTWRPIPDIGVMDGDFQYLEGYNPNTIRATTPTSTWSYLYGQGVRRVRVFMSWGSIQPTYGAALDSVETTRLTSEIANMHAAGLKMIVAIYNGGAGQGHYVQADLVDLWTRMSTLLQGNQGVLAYDILNEPNQITYTGSGTTAQNQADAAVWKPMSQAVVNAIRSNGDNTRIHVQGVNFSDPGNWSLYQGSSAWIADPGVSGVVLPKNIVYSAHLYPDLYGGLFTTADGNAVQNPTTGCRSDFRWSTTATWYQIHVTGGMALATYCLNLLGSFADWCHSNSAYGDIGESGWPSYWVMVNYQGLSTGTANTEVTNWQTNWGIPFLRWLVTNGLTHTQYAASGILPKNGGSWSDGQYPIFQNNAGGSVPFASGQYGPAVIDTTNSQYTSYQSLGIWPS